MQRQDEIRGKQRLKGTLTFALRSYRDSVTCKSGDNKTRPRYCDIYSEIGSLSLNQ